jgi:drug/metabolite transporter (DMT)-like permease
MIAMIVGGLFATAVFLYPALQLKKRNKWPPVMAILMFLAGLGLVGVSVALARLATSMTSVLIVGGIALILFAGFLVATLADLFPDKRIDHPWNLFMLPSLAAIVFITGGTTFAYLGDIVRTNATTLTSELDSR